MDCDLFHTTAFINEIHQLCAFVDPGLSAFATINQKYVAKFKLGIQLVGPRIITGVLSNISNVTNQFASMKLDIGGLLVKRVWAYVVPNQSEDLIPGLPWLRNCYAELDPVINK